MSIRPSVLCLLTLFCATVQLQAAATWLYVTENVPDSAMRQLAGRGITLPDGRESQAAYDAHGREIVWRRHHSVSDERGGNHVFYRQYLIGPGIEAEMDGTDVGVHYDPDGKLDFVNGTQFEVVMVTNSPDVDSIGAAMQARRSTLSFARSRVIEQQTPEMARQDAETAKLQVREVGGELRYVWRVSVYHPGHGEHDVIVDAQTERIVQMDDTTRGNNCYPDSQSSVSAVGKAVNPNITAPRTLRATVASPFRAPRVGYAGAPTYSHEGFWNAGPNLAVHQQVYDVYAPGSPNTNRSNWQCDSLLRYSLMALKMINGIPTYDDDVHGIFQGRAGGDALYNTWHTMKAFATMGRNSWNGTGGDATVLIDSIDAAGNQAFFGPSGRAPWQPPGAFVGLGRGVNYYSPAAALDVIAHEWGHGVTFTHPNFTRTSGNTVADQLDEGFADVIGNIVEKLRQPAGDGVEQSSDWTMHEDVSGVDPDRPTYRAYARGARDDGKAGHVWAVISGSNPARTSDKIHMSDPDVSSPNFPHTTGNVLVMAMRLMTEGGHNPLCDRNPSPITTCSNVPPLGFTKARKIMWNTLPNLTSSTPSWVDVANASIRAAYSQFKACGASPTYVPVVEQEAAKAAFLAVGVVATEPIKYTCQ